jgi:hypothetical protein
MIGNIRNIFFTEDIIIFFDQTKINEGIISNCMNRIHPHFEFTPTLEENNTTTYLDLNLHRLTHNIQLGTYRKPSHTDTAFNFT